MAEKDPYDIEPNDEPEDHRPGPPEIEAEELLEDFDEDADFERDPEVEAASRAAASPAGARRPAATPPKAMADVPNGEDRPLVRGGLGPWRLWCAIGVIEIVVAVVLTIVYAPSAPFPRALLTLYNALLHTGTGVTAVFVAALILQRPFGSLELAAARMMTAVGAFVLLFSIPIALTDTTIEELVFAAIAYVVVVAATFRVKGHPLMLIVGAHFILWLIVQIGMLLTQWMAAAPAAP